NVTMETYNILLWNVIRICWIYDIKKKEGIHMRIGIFTEAYKPLISGVVTSVVTLKEGLEALGHEVYVITPRAPKQKEELDSYVIRLRGIVIPRKSLKGFRLVPWVKRHLNRIKHLQLDLVHIHTEFSMG